MTKVPLLLYCALCALPTYGQARDGMLTDREVDTLRDTADSPTDRLKAYEQFLDDRDKQITSLLSGHRGAEFSSGIHDLMEQMNQIADELNDNLDDWDSKHRDLRKPLPKLMAASERWATALREPPEDNRYEVVRKEALDAVNDAHHLAETMSAEQAMYFKEHPEAVAEEKRRRDNPHAPE